MFYLEFEFKEGSLRLRRDLLDEGVVRKARNFVDLDCGWVVLRKQVEKLKGKRGETAAR
jgi:hypothetical protein